MRIAFLWGAWTGYIDAFTDYIRKERGVKVYRSRIGDEGTLRPSRLNFTSNYQFDDQRFCQVDQERVFSQNVTADEIDSDLKQFEPEGIICLPWRAPQYREVLRRWEGRAVRIACFDSQWRGNLKQIIGRAGASHYFKHVDAAAITGPRQIAFARRMGFKPTNTIIGFAVCDIKSFSASFPSSMQSRTGFLYVGRLEESKGLRTLLKAYTAYRTAVAQPWPLRIAGIGPMLAEVEATPGVEYLGFVQPQELPELFARSACLVLPSLFEPWGVVLQEAASAGLGIICTEECGAGDVYVQRGRNGIVVETGSCSGLHSALVEFGRLDQDALVECARVSRELARSITPESFADGLMNLVSRSKAMLDWQWLR